ncbi:AAA family ATPase, partial [Saccharomonospora iraqiensis]|uniref:AAA family ATPase n=1 Tax=Saccharomonospora iraqiensis TaxID=52698 RepID=UPI000A0796F3
MPAVVVTVGAAASGKTRLRHRLIAAGLDPARVINLDLLRADARRAAGGGDAPLERFTLPALRAATTRQRALAGSGNGYLADATHLRRVERREHLDLARETGLRTVCLLLPDLDVEVLLARNAARSADLRVPEEALRRHAHRRSLLDADGLRADGFDVVCEVDDLAAVRLTGGARPDPLEGSPCPLDV